MSLRSAPVPLTRIESRTAWLLAIVVAISRWPAISRTLWDWDEALFALALRDYDVVAHHPHPPGFPLFIGIAKLIPLDAFHALQMVTVVASLFVFPAMFFLARELRIAPPVAMVAASFLAFLPNVWFFGGTAFSDVPSMVLAVLACALLLRGCRSSAALVAGVIVLAIAAGFRPQNLLIGLVPSLVALYHRPRVALAAAVGGAAIIVASYASAARASGGWQPYRDAVARHEQYIRNTDSFLAPRHPGVIAVADDFLLRPFRAPLINAVIVLLVAIGLVRARPWLAVAIFGPFVILAWLYLDFHSASRFSIAYMPLYALLAALGLPARARVASASVVVALMVGWSWPVLRTVHESPSPPVAAIEYVRSLDHVSRIAVDEKLAAHAELLLRDLPRRIVRIEPGLVVAPDELLLREGASIAPGARNFARASERLSGIARPRYFEVSVVPGR